METGNKVEESIRRRLAEIHIAAPDSIGAIMDYELLACNPEAGEYVFQCKTMPWMRNIPGTLHGGICATVLDQAMGFVAYCIKPGEGIAPTVQMQVEYHRPLIPGKEVLVRVQVVSAGKTLMHLSSQAYQADQPDAICLSATGLYFYKPMKMEP